MGRLSWVRSKKCQPDPTAQVRVLTRFSRDSAGPTATFRVNDARKDTCRVVTGVLTGAFHRMNRPSPAILRSSTPLPLRVIGVEELEFGSGLGAVRTLVDRASD
jgi:hypothetical protein